MGLSAAVHSRATFASRDGMNMHDDMPGASFNKSQPKVAMFALLSSSDQSRGWGR